MRKRVSLAGAVAASLGCLSGPAFAQDMAAPADRSETATPGAIENSGELGDIIVTAQRRSESLQRTPLAVTALTPEALTDRSVRTSIELQQVVPSLQISTQTAGDGPGSATFFLRGLGQQRSANGSQPAVGIYIDDFYYPSLEGTIFGILDIQQVEVLRGPQGTLFGRNTIGGAIRYTTRKPDYDFSADASATIGSYGRRDFTGAINVPFGDKAALRLTAGSLDGSGYVLNQTSGKRNIGGSNTSLVRAQFRAQPTSELTIDLQAQYNRSRYDGFAYRLTGPFDRGQVSNIWNSIPPLSNPALGGTPYDSRFQSTCFYCQTGDASDRSEVHTYLANGVVALDVSPTVTVKSMTGYIQVKNESRSDLDGTPLPIFQLQGKGDIRALSQELQLNVRLFDDALKLVSGGYYYNERMDGDGIDGVGAIVIAQPVAATVTRRDTNTYAGYIDLSWKATDALSVLGGYRYSSDHIRQRSASGTAVFRGDATFGSSTGRLGLQYQWTPDVMTYATVSQGFRAGGFNTLVDGSLQPFRPEKLSSYEVGGRFTFLDRRLRLNPTVFYTRYRDVQVQRLDFVVTNPGPPPTVQPQITLLNAAKAHTYGLELEADLAVTKALHLFGHLATLHAEYDSVGTATGITTASPFQRAPTFSYGIGGTYTAALGDGSKLVGTLEYSAQTSQATTPTDSDRLIIPGYGIANLRLEYRLPGERISFAGFVTNLFDKEYFIGGVNYNETSPHFDIGRPREFGVTAKAKF